MKVLLLGNYPPDGQKSMQRFCGLMESGLRECAHEVKVVRPEAVLNLTRKRNGLAKWLGYLDKYVIFPLTLARQTDWADLAHICDHSNAVYLPQLGRLPSVITCHDLLAVRAALGEQTHCRVSSLGKWLQVWILSTLKQAKTIACDSTATVSDVTRLLDTSQNTVRLVPVGLGRAFRVLSESETLSRLKAIAGLDCTRAFLLHVGSAEPRKNRGAVIRIFARVKEQIDGQLVFVGDPLTDEHSNLAKDLGVADRILPLQNQSDESLTALYNRAFALLFPSLAEGFGWPVIEAQACGCPVISSDVEPCASIAGAGALLHSPYDDRAFAASINALKDESARQACIDLGLKNAAHYTSEGMIAAYLELYRETVTGPGAGKSNLAASAKTDARLKGG